MHYFMVVDPRFGYEQYPDRWGGDYPGGPIEFVSSSGRKYTLNPGSFDCSSSTIYVWRKSLEGTPFEGLLDGASYTGDMKNVFVKSGLFNASLTAAKRGDLYLNEGVHVAMCQDGGDDGVFNYDCLSEFNMNENGGANWGQPGDQTGYESVFREYYDDNWNTVLHYNGLGDYETEPPVKPSQNAGESVNNVGLSYEVHVQDVGWCPEVHDGQVGGTIGFGKRMEAIRFTNIPNGWDIYAKAHIQNVGWKDYGKIEPGITIGTIGKSNAIECLIFDAVSPEGDERKLYFRVHQQNVGWKGTTPQGYASGTDGMGLRLEAVKLWIA